MQSMTERVLEVQEATEGLEQVVQSIAELVYRYPAGKPGFAEEDAAEFLIRFYPRIRKLVRQYRQSGASFDRYLYTSLRWQLRTFAAQRTRTRVRLETSTERHTAYEILGHDPYAEPELHSSEPSPALRPAAGTASKTRRPGNRPCALHLVPAGDPADRLTPGEAQRLLCFALKSGDRLDAESRERLARVVGCDRAWLDARWNELRLQTVALRARQGKFRARRDRAWFRLRCIEKRLLSALPPERELLLHERARWSHRYTRARTELGRTAAGPTHAQIAGILGVARGTVDSGIYKMRGEIADPAYRERLARLFDET